GTLSDRTHPRGAHATPLAHERRSAGTTEVGELRPIWYTWGPSAARPARPPGHTSARGRTKRQEVRMGDITAPVSPAPSVPAQRRPRLWPGIVIVALYWAVLKVPAWTDAEPMTQFKVIMFGAMG